MNNIKAACVFPNKDFLLGYLQCVQSVQKGNPEWQNGAMQLPDGALTPSFEYKEPVMKGRFFELSCDCGYYISFATPNQIPNESLKCPLCEERYVIFYTQPRAMFEAMVVFDKLEGGQIKKDFARYVLNAAGEGQARELAQNALLSINKNVQKIDNITLRVIGNFLSAKKP